MQKDKNTFNWIGLIQILTVSCCFRLIPILLGSGQQDDMMQYALQAFSTFIHVNIYQVQPVVFPYTPVSMFVPFLCMVFTNVSAIPFHITMKIPAFLGDVSIAAAIYCSLAYLNDKKAYYWAMLYALNPLSILIASFHGNIMTLPVLFTFLSYIVLLSKEKNNYRLSALLLGIAIGLRGYPILLLPLFLAKLSLSRREKVKFALYCLLPSALSCVPFFLADPTSFLRTTFTYSGCSDFGLYALIRAVYSLKTARLFYGVVNIVPVWITKVVFLAAFLTILCNSKKIKLLNSIILVFLCFYVVYAGVAAQYLIWLLPFVFLKKDVFVYIYLLVAALAVVNFYLLYHPHILFGVFTVPQMPFLALLAGQVMLLGILWVIGGAWILRIVRSEKNTDSRFI